MSSTSVSDMTTTATTSATTTSATTSAATTTATTSAAATSAAATSAATISATTSAATTSVATTTATTPAATTTATTSATTISAATTTATTPASTTPATTSAATTTSTIAATTPATTPTTTPTTTTSTIAATTAATSAVTTTATTPATTSAVTTTATNVIVTQLGDNLLGPQSFDPKNITIVDTTKSTVVEYIIDNIKEFTNLEIFSTNVPFKYTIDFTSSPLTTLIILNVHQSSHITINPNIIHTLIITNETNDTIYNFEDVIKYDINKFENLSTLMTTCQLTSHINMPIANNVCLPRVTNTAKIYIDPTNFTDGFIIISSTYDDDLIHFNEIVYNTTHMPIELKTFNDIVVISNLSDRYIVDNCIFDISTYTVNLIPMDDMIDVKKSADNIIHKIFKDDIVTTKIVNELYIVNVNVVDGTNIPPDLFTQTNIVNDNSTPKSILFITNSENPVSLYKLSELLNYIVYRSNLMLHIMILLIATMIAYLIWKLQ